MLRGNINAMAEEAKMDKRLTAGLAKMEETAATTEWKRRFDVYMEKKHLHRIARMEDQKEAAVQQALDQAQARCDVYKRIKANQKRQAAKAAKAATNPNVKVKVKVKSTCNESASQGGRN